MPPLIGPECPRKCWFFKPPDGRKRYSPGGLKLNVPIPEIWISRVQFRNLYQKKNQSMKNCNTVHIRWVDVMQELRNLFSLFLSELGKFFGAEHTGTPTHRLVWGRDIEIT